MELTTIGLTFFSMTMVLSIIILPRIVFPKHPFKGFILITSIVVINMFISIGFAYLMRYVFSLPY